MDDNKIKKNYLVHYTFKFAGGVGDGHKIFSHRGKIRSRDIGKLIERINLRLNPRSEGTVITNIVEL